MCCVLDAINERREECARNVGERMGDQGNILEKGDEGDKTVAALHRYQADRLGIALAYGYGRPGGGRSPRRQPDQ